MKNVLRIIELLNDGDMPNNYTGFEMNYNNESNSYSIQVNCINRKDYELWNYTIDIDSNEIDAIDPDEIVKDTFYFLERMNKSYE